LAASPPSTFALRHSGSGTPASAALSNRRTISRFHRNAVAIVDTAAVTGFASG
jgi:hypothetical protein